MVDAGAPQSPAISDFLYVIQRLHWVWQRQNVHKGTAKIIESNKDHKVIKVIDAEKKELRITSKFLIIATGATSKNLPFVSSDGKNVLDYRTAMTPKELPKSLIIVGSGAIGSEFASFYNDLGCKVTIVEVQDKILPNEDHEISEFVLKSFKNRGIDIHINCELLSVDIKDSFRNEIADAVATCQREEIVVRMVTGNYLKAAKHI